MYHVPGTILGTRNVLVNKEDEVFALVKLPF